MQNYYSWCTTSLCFQVSEGKVRNRRLRPQLLSTTGVPSTTAAPTAAPSSSSSWRFPTGSLGQWLGGYWGLRHFLRKKTLRNLNYQFNFLMFCSFFPTVVVEMWKLHRFLKNHEIPRKIAVFTRAATTSENPKIPIPSPPKLFWITNRFPNFVYKSGVSETGLATQ